MKTPVPLAIWEALGANPTPMAFGELFSALEQGVVDGQENPWSTILTSNFNEVQDSGPETRHVYTPFIMMLSERTWDRMATRVPRAGAGSRASIRRVRNSTLC